MNPPRTALEQTRVFDPICAVECTLTAADIERLVAEKLAITPGSCTISRAAPKGRSHTTLFRVIDANGKTVLGRIEVRVVADEFRIEMIPEVRVLGWVQWRAPFAAEEQSPAT